MNILKKLVQESYFSIIQYDLEDSEEMHQVLSQSRISKRNAENCESTMKLIYENGEAVKLVEIEEGNYLEDVSQKIKEGLEFISQVKGRNRFAQYGTCF